MNVALSAKMRAFTALKVGEEAIRYTLFHYMNPAAQALPTMTFFQAIVGQQDQFGAQVSNEDTNMDVAGTLQKTNRMFVTNISVPIEPSYDQSQPITGASSGSIGDDIAQVAKRGFFQFFLLVKPYLSLSPLSLLPSATGAWAALANGNVGNTDVVAHNGFPSGEPVRGYPVTLPLNEQTTFKAVISFPKGAVTTLNALRLGVQLHGVLYRPEQ